MPLSLCLVWFARKACAAAQPARCTIRVWVAHPLPPKGRFTPFRAPKLHLFCRMLKKTATKVNQECNFATLTPIPGAEPGNRFKVQGSRFKVLGQAKRRPKAVRLHRQAKRPRVIMVAQVVFDATKIRILKAIHNGEGARTRRLSLSLALQRYKF